MAENQEGREKMSLDFGIETTTDMGMDNTLVLDSLFGSPKGNPDDIKLNDGKSSSTTETTTKKVDAQKKEGEKPAASKKPDVFEPSAEDLLGTTEEEEENNEGDSENTSTETTDNEEDNQEGVEESPYTLMARDLIKLGVFTKGEDEKDEDFVFDDPKKFLGRFQYEVRKNVSDTISSYLSRFGEDYQNMFDAVFVNGVDPQSYLQTFTKLQDVSSLDMTKEKDQERAYREYWRRQGFGEDKIEAKLQRAKVNGELEEDSIDFHKRLVEEDAQELQRKTEEAEQLQLRKVEAKRQLVQTTTKLLNEALPSKEYQGIPLSPQIAQQALAFITQDKYKLNGEPITEFDKYILELQKPENHALKMKMTLLMLNNFDLSKVKVKEANKEAEELFRFATRTKDGKKTNSTAGKKPAVIDDKF